MNNKGFTLIELLAVIIVLSIIGALTFSTVSSSFGKAKEETEKVFVDTIKDALDMYLSSSNAKGLFSNASLCSNVLSKTHGNVSVYKVTTNFDSVIGSEYHPISQDDLVNPANEKKCSDGSNITVSIYRDDDYVYYYSVNKADLNCLNNNVGKISNLPEGFSC